MIFMLTEVAPAGARAFEKGCCYSTCLDAYDNCDEAHLHS